MNIAFRCMLILALGLLTSSAAQNILLIIADDYGADGSDLYNSTATGASLAPTPTIDALAQTGVVFGNAYANPVCSPTRACIITGRAAFRTGVGDVIAGMGSPILQASEFTLPEAFAANSGLNYSVAQFGKWHLANGPSSPNNLGGWPHYAGNLSGALTNYYSWAKTVDGVTTGTTNYATTDIVNDAVAWIQSQGTKPWFAWVAFNAPHTPFHKPPNSLCPHYTSLSGTQSDINQHPLNYYQAMLEALDTEIARLLASVNRSNTHIIFLGDNGSVPQVIQPPLTSSRAKNSIYEGGTKVPMIIAGPSVVNPGRTNTTPVHALDLYSTILELAGINVAATVPSNVVLDSKSLVPLVQSTNTLSRFVYTEQFGSSLSASVSGRTLRNDRYKLLQFYDARQEFYDLLTDPTEKTNLLSGTLTSPQQANYYNLVLGFGNYTILSPPTVTSYIQTANQFSLSVQRVTNLSYSLWHAATLDSLPWSPVTNALIITNNASTVTLTDPAATNTQQFYRVGASMP